jgi:hypothetical protein
MKVISSIFLMLLLMTRISAQEISVSPSRLFFIGVAGQTYSQQVLLHNSGSEKAIFRSGLMDWKRDSLGNKVYAPAGTFQGSNASWVEVRPNIVEIEPGARKEVTVVLHVPKEEAGNTKLRNSMLFLTQVNAGKAKLPTGGKTSLGVLIKLEFGLHVYYTPPTNQLKDMEFTALYLDRGTAAGAQKRVAVKIKNTGNVVVDGHLKLELTNKGNGKDLKLPLQALSMLPGDEQVVYQELPDNLQGDYLLVALLDNGEETNLKVAKKDVTFH